MHFVETSLAGAFVIELERLEDDRGFFARTWCRREFEEQGLSTEIAQCNLSFNRRAGTLRGLHYQVAPNEEAKTIRCTRGAVYDVIVDLRPESPTFKQWNAVKLSAGNRSAIYVPEGFAHGFQTLVDETEMLYQVSEFHTPEAERGLRWDDPTFGIVWPETAERILSDRDRAWLDFEG